MPTPGEATLRGNVRFLEPDGSAVFRDHIERVARGIADTYGVAIDVDYMVGRPPTVNAEAGGGIAREAAATLGAARNRRGAAGRRSWRRRTSPISSRRGPAPSPFSARARGGRRCTAPDYDFNDAILVPGAAFLGPACRARARCANASAFRGRPDLQKRKAPRKRLTHDERKALILDRAADYLSENGFPVRTRRLAAAAGISQRLIYHFFPNKSALIDEIYDSAIQGPFKAI